MNIESKLIDLGIEIPEYQQPNVPLIPSNCVGNTVFSSGNTATVCGTLKYSGTVGENVTIEEAKEAAKIATLNCLSGIKHTIGDLNRIKKIIKVNGFVACTSDFKQQAEIINTASNLIISIFGERGKHARSALGVAALPGGSPVEVEIVAEIE